MIPGMNPRDMQKMMKRMGIQQQEVAALEVVIRCEDKEIVIASPQVTKVNMMGQETFQIVGEVSERAPETAPAISEEDIQMVMEQTSVDKAKAKAALQAANGDLAQAIMDLQE